MESGSAAASMPEPVPLPAFLPGRGPLESHGRADVAELVDAHGSGPCGGNPVEVQVLSSVLSQRRRSQCLQMRLVLGILLDALYEMVVDSDSAGSEPLSLFELSRRTTSA